jgi:hypothetical protein
MLARERGLYSKHRTQSLEERERETHGVDQRETLYKTQSIDQRDRDSLIHSIQNTLRDNRDE